MKFAGPLFLAAALLLSAAVRAQEAQDASDGAAGTATVASADKPYATIVARNMFGLLPIPPPPPPPEPPKDPVPKITLTGIMTIFGRDQALFKVGVRPKAGQPAQEKSYVLAVGERQEDVEVVNIDHEKGVVSFNNHGEPQELSLTPAKDSGSATGAPIPGMANSMSGFPLPRPGGPMTAGDRAAMLRERQNSRAVPGTSGLPTTPSDPNMMPGTRMVGGTSVNERGIYQPQADNSLTPEQEALLIETQRKVYEQQGNPIAPLLPPTRGDVKQLLKQLDENP